MINLKSGRNSAEFFWNSPLRKEIIMFNIFNQIANLTSGTLAVAAAVSNAAPQVSAETHKQATLDLTGVALHAAAKVATASSGNLWVVLSAQILPAIYDEIMTVVNKNGLIASQMAGNSAAK
jgi:hypothetical protein